jgi:ribosomal protein S18 acetylase RimI-like enzyme
VVGPLSVELRPATEADRPLLEAVYAASRAAELEPVLWPDEVKAAFLASQFALQDTAYRGAYPDGRFLVVEVDGRSAGRLYLADLPGELRIVDIALLPAVQGRGVGTRLLDDVLAEAEARALPVTLHVERWNPAWRLYQRLGFTEVEERGAYVLLRRDPTLS